jgi:hypothetical protein
LDLFEWKNGPTAIPGKTEKLDSVLRHFVARRAELDQIRQDESMNQRQRFSRASAKGDRYSGSSGSIAGSLRGFRYTTSMFTGMRFIQARVREEIPEKEPDKIEAYLDQYMPSHSQFDGIAYRAVDKALWSFGKFIGSNNFPLTP